MKVTLYQILRVDPKATAEEIGNAYALRRQELDASPSRDSAALQLLREAHERLSDPRQRAAYDRSLSAPTVTRLDEEPSFLGRWGRWIVGGALVAAILAWWAASRDTTIAKPAAKPRSPPTVVIELNEPKTETQASGSAQPARDSEPSTTQGGAPIKPAVTRSAEEVFAEVAPSVALVAVSDSSGRPLLAGSGVVIESGVVLTNCHVAKGGAKLTVKAGQRTLAAKIQLADETFDLCRLSVAGLEAPPVVIGTVGSLRTGQRVYAIGAPVGLELTISEGIVSALREVDGGTVIQTTAPISPGSSGGGLFDAAGQLVGIMTFQHRYGQNLNFAVPADWIAQMRARGPDSGNRTASRAAEQSPADLIVGEWNCRSAVSGRSGRYAFERDGTVNIAMTDGKVANLRYRVSGKVLQIADDQQGGSLAIEELTPERMILNTNVEGRRLVCEHV